MSRRRERAKERQKQKRRNRGRFVVAGVAVVVALALRFAMREAAPPEVDPVEGIRLEASGGANTAVLDPELLAAWCERYDLPEPAAVRQMEGKAASNLSNALLLAATEPSAETFGRVGQIWSSIDANTAALAYFARARENDPRDFRWPYYEGAVHQKRGASDESIAALNAALALNEGYAVTHARLGQLMLEAGDLDQATEFFERYRELAPDDWLGEVGLGRVALEKKDATTALTLLKEAFAKGPDDFQVNFYLGRAHALLGNRETANGFLERARELPQGAWFAARDVLDRDVDQASDSVAGLVAEFERLSETQDWPRLIALAEQIVDRRADDVTMLGNLAGLYRKTGRFEDAHRSLDRAFDRGIDEIRLWNLRAELFLAQEKLTEVLGASDSVLARDSTNARAHAVAARVFFMRESYAEAESRLRASLDQDSSSPDNWFLLGESLLAQGKVDAAEAAYQETLTRSSAFRPAVSRLAEIRAHREQN